MANRFFYYKVTSNADEPELILSLAITGAYIPKLRLKKGKFAKNDSEWGRVFSTNVILHPLSLLFRFC